MSLANSFINLLTNLILKTQTKILDWSIYTFITHGGILNLHITTINLKFQLQLGMMNLTCLMDHIQSQTFNIILSMLLKNMRNRS